MRVMASKLWSRTSTVTFSRTSAAKLGPIVNAVGDFASDGRKKPCKRPSEESLERGTKRTRPNQSLSEGSRQTFNTAKSVSSFSAPPVITAGTQNLSSKRKSTSVERDERPKKRPRQTPSPRESPNHQTTTEASTSDDAAPLYHCRDDFEAKYEEGELLGEGGFGSVYAGQRKEDNLPVAIKHINEMFVSQHKVMELEGKSYAVPLEVALLLTLQPKDGQTNAVVALLDWYNLDDELIIVLERPVPCMDMADYLNSKQPSLPENKAKILTRQLLDALIELHSKRVFHKDIKLDNILIETSSEDPRVRLIDFGCGMFLPEDGFYTESWLPGSLFKAELTTVWQLGAVVFSMVHGGHKDRHVIIDGDPDIDPSLSTDCQDFLTSTLFESPETRPTLDELKRHSWLM